MCFCHLGNKTKIVKKLTFGVASYRTEQKSRYLYFCSELLAVGRYSCYVIKKIPPIPPLNSVLIAWQHIKIKIYLDMAFLCNNDTRKQLHVHAFVLR